MRFALVTLLDTGGFSDQTGEFVKELNGDSSAMALHQYCTPP